MKLSIGIVGLPNVGKSLLFNILTKQQVNTANYPFATIDPNIGIVPVPDERVDKLAEMSKSAKKVPAVVEFYDIAGLVKGANKGEGLGNQFLSHIRDVSAIVQVVRCFESGEIIHVENSVNPIRDIDTINTELALKDLDTVEKRFGKLEGEARTGDKQKMKELEIVKKAKDALGEDKLIFNLGKDFINEPAIKELNLLTAKQQIYLLNGKEGDVSEELKSKIKSLNADYIVMDLSSAQNLDDLIKKAYQVLNLISFLTTGEDETRAWTIENGYKAPQAAGVIHTDFEHKFIKAEVIDWKKLLEATSWSGAKQKGWLRLEGKEYVVKDGDVVVIKHG
jgi:hypothetical protein